jgi:flagellar biosynthesis protein FlhF
MEELRKSVSRKREQASAGRGLPLSPKIAATLLEAGFPQTVADDLARAMQIRSRDDKETIAGALETGLSERIRVSPRLGSEGPGRSIVAVVGPPGSGKTTTLVKLAATYGLATNRPTRFLSTDTYRLGGTDLLSKYARWMGVRVDMPASLEAVERSLGAGDRNELLLIDTAGYSRANIAAGLPLAGLLSKRAGIDVHLVLPAYAAASELASLLARFRPFVPSKLLFTGVDTCESIAPALALAIAADMPLSFLGIGDQAPEDLEEASAATLAARLLPVLMEAAASAA